jgi:hypothetical protein
MSIVSVAVTRLHLLTPQVFSQDQSDSIYFALLYDIIP